MSPVVSSVLLSGTIGFLKNSEPGRHMWCVPVFTVTGGIAGKAICSTAKATLRVGLTLLPLVHFKEINNNTSARYKAAMTMENILLDE